MLFGWFYVRNQVRYGDIGASAFVLDYFRRRPAGSIVHILGLGHVWVNLYQRMALTGRPSWHIPRFTTAIAVLALAGLVVALVTKRRGWWRGGMWLSIGAVALITLTVAQHVAGGGNPYPRYFFPVLGVLACLTVLGLDRLLPRVLPLAVVVAMACWLMSKLPISVDPHAWTVYRRPRDGLRPTPVALRVLAAGDMARRLAGVLIVAGGVAAAYGLIAESVRGVRRHHRSNQSPIEAPGSDHTSSASLGNVVGSRSGANT